MDRDEHVREATIGARSATLDIGDANLEAAQRLSAVSPDGSSSLPVWIHEIPTAARSVVALSVWRPVDGGAIMRRTWD